MQQKTLDRLVRDLVLGHETHICCVQKLCGGRYAGGAQQRVVAGDVCSATIGRAASMMAPRSAVKRQGNSFIFHLNQSCGDLKIEAMIPF